MIDEIKQPHERRLMRWLKKLPWPPHWGWGWCCCGARSSQVTHACQVASSLSCSGIPDTLHVTFSNTGNCPDLDGQTVTLTYQASGTLLSRNQCSGTPAWEGSIVGATCTWAIDWSCGALGSLKSSLCLAKVTGTSPFAAFITANITDPSPKSCSPFSLTYGITIGSGQACCGTGRAAVFSAVVTV